MSNEEVRNKLLDAAIQLLRQKPADRITIREIAKASGTNSAAISYHFESKEKLFQEANHYYWLQLNRIYKSIMEEKQLTPEKAEQYSARIMKFYLESAGVLRTEQNSLMNKDVDNSTKERINFQLQAVQYMIKSLKPEVSALELTVKAVRFISALAYPALWAGMNESAAVPGMSQRDLVSAYIKDIVANI